MFTTERGAIIGTVTVLFIFGFMFLFSGFCLLVPGFGFEGNLFLVCVGVLSWVSAVFLARTYWSVIKPSM